ncbi:MAG: hypothetical protein ACK5MF_05005 [Vibrio sp.]|uniref:hypothetical protein n=1 Tax=Vibrio sp. TaxID=678 RepID=UPI003A8C5C49
MPKMLKQRGAISIIVIIFLPMILLFTGFVIYTSQMHLSHIKTIEATEIASLALIAREVQTGEDDLDQSYARSIVERYLQDASRVNVSFRKHECDYENACVTVQDAGPYVSNTLSVSSVYDSWLNFLPISQTDTPFFEPEIHVNGGEITAERYSARPLDVYFIVDFSGSMSGGWGYIDSVYMNKLKMVKYTIERILAYLEENQDPRYPAKVSLATYSDYNYQKYDGQVYRISHNYRDATAYCPGQTVGMMWIHPRLWDDEPFLPSSSTLCDNDRITYYKPRSSYYYYDIDPTYDYDLFNSTLASFNYYGGTYSWQGLIAAAQQADKATNNTESVNPEQIFILLSDGADGAQSFTRSVMETYGLCEQIRDRISSKPNRFSGLTSSPTIVTMAVIGMAHNVHTNLGFGSCFGNKIYNAEAGTDDVYKQILKLLVEATGRFKSE